MSDPVTPEVVSVPTRGVERWITQRLSHRLGATAGGGGVCANLEFPFPGALVGRVAAAATGITAAADPWAPERAVWPLIEIIDGHQDDPGLAPLHRHLLSATPPARDGGDSPTRRFTAARHLADLFDRYGVHRPDMLRRWAGGVAAEGWQAHLWLLLRTRIGVPSPAERLPEAIAAIGHDGSLADLPERLSLFGLTRLPAAHLQILSAMGRERDVHLFLLHPSGGLWAKVAGALGSEPRIPSRAADPTRRLPDHPLLGSWGRDAREMQLVLAGHGLSEGHHHPVAPAPDPERAPLLRRLQDDIRADRLPVPAAAPLDPSDDSLRIYSCHGRGRQVEVLRDAILHRLQEDRTLEPRDVIVMCPDIEVFAPLIQAAFGANLGSDAGAGPPGLPHVRVRLADRSIRQTNPLLTVAGLLLDLAGARVVASSVLDLAARPPVSRRFRFDRDDLATIERWVAETGVRWGLDADHRRDRGLGRITGNTWSRGLDRLTLGAAMVDQGSSMFAGTVPYGDPAGSRLELIGRLVEMVERLGQALRQLGGRQSVTGWAGALAAATEMLAVPDPGEAWQQEQLARTLAGTVEEAGGSDLPHLSLEEVRSLLAGRLAGRPTRANFRTGDLTFCTLVPMRSVPHRVVGLLGLDDGEFPRHPEPDGDDLLLSEPLVGDREARSEDRQLLLDAVLAAGDHLIVTYSGRDERTNRPRPPCAAVSELLDVVDAMAVTGGGAPAREVVLVHHPLQPFDRRNFESGRLGRPGPWSFDAVHLDGAVASRHRRPRRAWIETPLPPLAQRVIQLEDLVQFLQHPVRGFLRQRLSLYLGDRDVEVSDALPLELDPLEKWSIGDRMLEAAMAGVDLGRAVLVEEGRGLIPPLSIASPVLEEVRRDVEELMGAMAAEGLAPGRESGSCEVRVALPDGRLIAGSVPNVRDGVIVQCVYSRLAAKHRLAAWTRFLALTADRPDLEVRSVSVGKGPKGKPVATARFEWPPGGGDARRAWALERLSGLVRLYDHGMCEPLPLACRTSAAWAEGRHRGLDEPDVLTRAQREWDGGYLPGEREDAEHTYVFGATDFLGLLRDRPAPDRLPGWPTGERYRFGGLAVLLWAPLLESERSQP